MAVYNSTGTTTGGIYASNMVTTIGFSYVWNAWSFRRFTRSEAAAMAAVLADAFPDLDEEPRPRRYPPWEELFA